LSPSSRPPGTHLLRAQFFLQAPAPSLESARRGTQEHQRSVREIPDAFRRASEGLCSSKSRRDPLRVRRVFRDPAPAEWAHRAKPVCFAAPQSPKAARLSVRVRRNPLLTATPQALLESTDP